MDRRSDRFLLQIFNSEEAGRIPELSRLSVKRRRAHHIPAVWVLRPPNFTKDDLCIFIAIIFNLCLCPPSSSGGGGGGGRFGVFLFVASSLFVVAVVDGVVVLVVVVSTVPILVALLCVVVVVVISTVVVVVAVVLVVALEGPFEERVLRRWTGRGGPGGRALPPSLSFRGHHRPCRLFVLCLHVCLGLASAARCLRRRCCDGWCWFWRFLRLLRVAHFRRRCLLPGASV